MKTTRSEWIRMIALAVVLAGMVRSARASLIWSGENQADANTLALYHFNAGSGVNAADASGNGFNATLTSDFYASEGSGSWLGSGGGTYLSGTSGAPGDYVNTISVSGVDWDQGLTISLWYRVRDEAGSPNNNSIFYMANGTTPRLYLSTDTFGAGSNGRLNFTDENGAFPNSSTGNADFGTNHAWRHIALVYDSGGNAADGGLWNMYLDNVKVGNTATNVQDLSSGSSFQIRFMGNIFNTNGLSADMDEVLIQNGVITDFSNAYNAIPEPASILLLGIGLLGAACQWSRRG